MKTQTNTSKEMAAVASFLLDATDRKDMDAIRLGLAAKDELERKEPFPIALARVLRRRS